MVLSSDLLMLVDVAVSTIAYWVKGSEPGYAAATGTLVMAPLLICV